MSSPAGAEETASDLASLAAEAYIYGFALVFDLQEVDRFTRDGLGSVAPAPFNVVRRTRRGSPDSQDERFVSINNDTVYSIAQRRRQRWSGAPWTSLTARRPLLRDAVRRRLDQQLRLRRAPRYRHRGRERSCSSHADWERRAAGRRETVIQLPDARWRRSSGAGRSTVRPTCRPYVSSKPRLTPGSAARAARGARALPRARLGCRGRAALLRAAPRLDAGLPARRARPHLPAAVRAAGSARRPTLRIGDGRLGADRERCALGWRWVAKNDGTTRCRNSDAPRSERVEAWPTTSFDYNLDFFELGTLDEPRWKLADDPSRYLERALAARGGLWGNHGYEAAYAMAWDGR